MIRTNYEQNQLGPEPNTIRTNQDQRGPIMTYQNQLRPRPTRTRTKYDQDQLGFGSKTIRTNQDSDQLRLRPKDQLRLGPTMTNEDRLGPTRTNYDQDKRKLPAGPCNVAAQMAQHARDATTGHACTMQRIQGIPDSLNYFISNLRGRSRLCVSL